MATRSRIVIQTQESEWKSIYCHWDGYPDYMLPILNEHYSDLEKCNELMNLGDISILDKNIGEKIDFNDNELRKENEQCLAYGRDRNEANTQCLVRNLNENFKLYSGEEYMYIRRLDGKWYFRNA